MAIELSAAACDALAAWLEALDGVDEGKRGWPEHRESLDLSGRRVVATVTAVGTTPNDCSPARVPELSVDNGDGTLTETYRVGWPVVRAQVDVWCAYRAGRDDAVQAIEAGREPALPAAGLRLTSSGYFSRPLRVLFVNGPELVDEQAAAEAGEWRARWEVEIHTDRVVSTTHPKTTQVDLELTTTTQGASTTVTISDVTG